MSHLPGSREDDPTGAAALASRFDQGLSLRSTMGGLDGTTSAPPPPGFGAAPDQRDGAYRLDVARGMLFQGGADGDGIVGSGAISVGGGNADITASGSGGDGVRLQGFSIRGQGVAAPIGTRISEGNGIGGLRQQGSGALLRPSELAAYASDMGRSLSAPLEDIDGQGMRSTSYANLAAALGEDLAESMNDSLQKQQSLNNLSGNGAGQRGQHQHQHQHLPR